MLMEHCIWQGIAAGLWYTICAHLSASVEKFGPEVLVQVCILELPGVRISPEWPPTLTDKFIFSSQSLLTNTGLVHY
jgi:hypothetical protein